MYQGKKKDFLSVLIATFLLGGCATKQKEKETTHLPSESNLSESSSSDATSQESDLASFTILSEKELTLGLHPFPVNTPEEKPEAVKAAWKVYGKHLTALLVLSERKYALYQEVQARQVMIEAWLIEKQKDPNLIDETLDVHVAARKAGFLREYVWSYFYDPEWGAMPIDLKLSEFATWLLKEHPNHLSEQLTLVVYVRSLDGKSIGRLYPNLQK